MKQYCIVVMNCCMSSYYHSLIQIPSSVTALEYPKVLRNSCGHCEVVWQEWCHGRTKSLEDAKEAARWWR